MEVILREDIDKLGQRGEVVKVAAGYARNFLLPRNAGGRGHRIQQEDRGAGDARRTCGAKPKKSATRRIWPS